MANNLQNPSVDNVPIEIREDKNAPYSFLQWKNRRSYSNEESDPALYSYYVLEWFKEKAIQTNTATSVVRQKYILLLNQLQLFFTEDEKNNWYGKLNLLDEKELLLAIPFFARKLKEISLYYLKLRKKVKQSKQRFSRIGTTTSIENEIRTQILELLNDTTEKSYYTNTSPLSDLTNNLVVKVEQLYDEQVYFDRSESLPATAYYNLFDEKTVSFFETKGIVLSSNEWLFNTFNLTVSSNLDSIIENLSKNYFEATDAELYKSFLETFLAENKYTTDTKLVSTKKLIYDLSLNEGNNKFYYPYGTTENTSNLKEYIKPIALSSLFIDGSTAGTTLEEADTIFIKFGNELKAAWLQFKEYEEYSVAMNAIVNKDANTDFIFPYPGFGISNNNLEWSGPSFETTEEYKFLSKEFKIKTDLAYWGKDYSFDSCNSVLLNNSNLASNGATPSKNPNLADQISIRPPGSNRDSILIEDTEAAWLFRFDKTSIPVLNGGENVIVWPYVSIDTEEGIEPIYGKINFSEVCDEISIQKMQLPYAAASKSFAQADKIYKIQKYNDPIEKAIECAWLSGVEITFEKTRFIDSNNFNALFEAGEFTKFVWNGPDTLIENVFKTIKHDSDCPFALGKADIGSPELCTCRQIYYTPFGHPGRRFSNYGGFADCVIQETSDVPSDFDFSSWRSTEGNTINQDFPILEFAWYQTNTKEGWGDGKWITGPISTGAEFYLRTGKVYYYGRVNSKIYDATYPPYIVFHKHNTSSVKTVWVEAKREENGTWNSTGKTSTMQIYPGDILKYEKRSLTNFEFLSSIEVPVNISSTGKNAWISTDIVPVGTKVDVFFPSFIKDFDVIDPQYPNYNISSISAVLYWEIELLNNPSYPIPDRVYTKSLNFSFTPTVTGVYKITMTNLMRDGRPNTIETIPTLTVLPKLSTEIVPVIRTTPRSSFVIEQDLTGWSYNKRRRFPTSPGAKPYWAVLHTEKGSSNKFKGTQAWGYQNNFVDNYLPINIPLISPLELNYQNVISYKRRGEAFRWKQDIQFKEGKYTTQWCELTSTVVSSSNIAESFSTKDKPELLVFATDKPSSIILTNDIQGYNPEIEYNAINAFTWSITADVEIPLNIDTSSTPLLEAKNPTGNIVNRFYPTIANIPTLEKTFSEKEVGGYFLPQHLGVSLLTNKDFLVVEKGGEQKIKEETNVHIGGLGLTKQRQETNYTWKENNEWVMEGSVAGKLAGAPKKTLTRELQTFIPYQANSDETPLGLLNSKSKYSPWGGANAEDWIDNLNEPKSFTGVRNLSSWFKSQILKQISPPLECWVDDLYGNQYGLFKNVEKLNVAQKREAFGELWVRTNQQRILKGSQALSALFSPFEPTSLFQELTGNGIIHIDCFFDTLMIETSSTIFFAEVLYDYNNGTIDCIYDDVRSQSLTANSYRYENSWFFTKEKRIVNLMTSFVSGAFVPKLWELETSTKNTSFSFPSSAERLEIISALSGLSAQSVSRGVINYNDLRRKYVLTYSGYTIAGHPFVVNFYVISNGTKNTLEKVEKYTNTVNVLAPTEPPEVIKQYLSAIPVSANVPFNITVSAINEPIYYRMLNYENIVSVNNSGTFSGTLSSSGIFHINYGVGNKIGETYYSLTLVTS